MVSNLSITRRRFLQVTGSLLVSPGICPAAEELPKPESIIDIHQHTTYGGRTNAQLIAHQRAMGVTHTILLPAGRLYGLDAGCGGNESVVKLAKDHPKQFSYFANEVTDLPEAETEIRKYLAQGAIGIGEQKFRIAADSKYMEMVATIAQEFDVPVLLHFWEGSYNVGIAKFHHVLEKFPRVHFIGHAQTWWGNIDKNHDQTVAYPTGRVTPGGITDRLLSDYPNMHGDLSAGSGLNALIRDEEHTRDFLQRHQNKLLYGSDCNDLLGRGPGCQGAQTLAAVRRLAPSKSVERKLLFENSKKLLKLRV